MRDATKKPWFRVKRYGYGVGLPIAWEGWAVLFLYLSAATLSAVLLSPLPAAIVIFFSTAAVLYVAYIRSDDEWRWRKGE